MLSALILTALVSRQGGLTFVFTRGEVPNPGVARPIRYWGVQDTTLDSLSPNESLGGTASLIGGPQQTILIQFSNLDLASLTGPKRYRKVLKASLKLTQLSGSTPTLKAVSRVLLPWGEGPAVRLAPIKMTKSASGETTVARPEEAVAHRAATWKERLAGEETWQTPGALGNKDSAAIKEATLSVEGKGVSIDGLEATIQEMIDHPYENHGFALSFSAPVEFASSKSQNDRPRLVLELGEAPAPTGPDLSVTSIESSPSTPKDGETVTWTAHVKNVGDAPSSGFSGVWSVGDRPGTPSDNTKALAPGEETTLSIQHVFHVSKLDHRGNNLLFKITPNGSDADPTNNAVQIQEGAVPVTVNVPKEIADAQGSRLADYVQAQARAWNEEVLPHSQFSFAPDGALERARIQAVTIGGSTDVLKGVGLGLGLKDASLFNIQRGAATLAPTRAALDLFPGLLGAGDTRYEGFLPGRLNIPLEPYYVSFTDAVPMVSTDLLNASEVGFLNTRLGLPVAGAPSPYDFAPGTLVLRALDFRGRPLASTELSIYQSKAGKIDGAAPTLTVKTNENGNVVLTSKGPAGPFGTLDADLGNGVFLIKAVNGGLTEWGWLKAWHLTQALRRGSTAAAVLDVRFNVSGNAQDTSADLATDRIITDSEGDLPAKLSALIDDSEDTEATLPDKVGSWVEIDLGRDRTIAEVRLVSKSGFWKKFDIIAYGTGQKVEEAAEPWSRELNWAWTAANRSDSADRASVAYRNLPQKVRYLRIVNRSGGEGKLGAIHVYPAKL